MGSTISTTMLDMLSVGTDHDTTSFAAHAIRLQWRTTGNKRRPDDTRLLITADRCRPHNSYGMAPKQVSQKATKFPMLKMAALNLCRHAFHRRLELDDFAKPKNDISNLGEKSLHQQILVPTARYFKINHHGPSVGIFATRLGTRTRGRERTI